MMLIKRNVSVIAFVLLAFSGILRSQTDGDKTGDVKKIDRKTGEVTIGSFPKGKDVRMGELVYARVDGKVVLLRATFPMQTIVKCRAEGANRALAYKLVPGAPVYAYVKDIENQSAKIEPVSSKEYKIGDRGPGNGYIFYDKGTFSDGWRYLEAAEVDQENMVKWHNGKAVATGASGTAIGTGKDNTAKILKAQGEGRYAAKLCADYRGGGKRDWFLPSKDELDMMYTNLKKTGIVDFSGRFCWSSSERDGDNAYFQAFMFGYQNDTTKNDEGRIRAVRSF